MSMRTFIRAILAAILSAAIGLIGFLLLQSQEKEIWATITGLLAVIAAVISSFPALRVLELQDDALRPQPTPYFDLSSRYQFLQLRVKNIGPSVAYDVRLRWKTRPRNFEGEEITALDNIPALLPNESVSVNVGTSMEFVPKYADTLFEGEVHCKDSNGKPINHQFFCSTQGHLRRLVHDDELPRTLYDLQKIPGQLEKIVNALDNLRDGRQE